MNKKALFALIIIELMILMPISTALIISDVDVSPSSGSAVVNWTTSLPADAEINYGTLEYDNTITVEEYTINHSVLISDLQEHTKYYYEIISIDENGSVANPYESYFVTLDVTPPPKVENFLASEVEENSISLTWDIVNVVDFEKYIIYRDGEELGDIRGISHTDSGLEPGITYRYIIVAVDTSGNVGEMSDEIVVTTIGEDVTPPIISNLEILQITDNGASFSWNTDEEANSKIFYGIEQESLDGGISEDELVVNHSMTLSGLTKDSGYYYKAVSCDEKGNCGESEVSYFVAGSDVIPPFINITIPEYYSTTTLDIPINTEPLTNIKIYVNEQLKRAGTSNVDGYLLMERVLLSSAVSPNIVKILATDFAGNQYDESYNIIMDFEDPSVNFTTNISEVTTLTYVEFQGFVNEQSNIQFFIELQPFDTIPPPQIGGVGITDVQETSVSLTWDAIEDLADLKYYKIYKKDVGVIGTSTTNAFVDEVVLPGAIYEYWISAVDVDCIEGESSDSFSVKTIEANETDAVELNLTYEEVVLECSGDIVVVELDTSGSFKQQVSLGIGINLLKMKVRDLAGNEVIYEFEVISDSQAPVFEDTNFIRDLSPTYSQNVVLEGKVNEPCDIYVYINEMYEENSTADYSGKTDNDGSFSIPIKLKKDRNIEGADSLTWENEIIVVAKDIVGQSAITSDVINFINQI